MVTVVRTVSEQSAAWEVLWLNIWYSHQQLLSTKFSKIINISLKKSHNSVALKTGLSKSYADVSVKVEDCPNLRKPPFYLATEGLTGSQTIVDVGGDSYLLPCPNFTRIYDLVDIAQKALPNAETISITGPGAGPFMVKNRNCEVKFLFP